MPLTKLRTLAKVRVSRTGLLNMNAWFVSHERMVRETRTTATTAFDAIQTTAQVCDATNAEQLTNDGFKKITVYLYKNCFNQSLTFFCNRFHESLFQQRSLANLAASQKIVFLNLYKRFPWA